MNWERTCVGCYALVGEVVEATHKLDGLPVCHSCYSHYGRRGFEQLTKAIVESAEAHT